MEAFKIKEAVIGLHEIIHFFGFGFFFVLSVSSIILTINFLYSILIKKDYHSKTKLTKILLSISIIISIICIFDFVIAGDITPKWTTQEIAGGFCTLLCQGSLYLDENAQETEKRNIFTPAYGSKFFRDWNKEKLKRFLGCNLNFELVEYHYERGNQILYIEKAKVVFQEIEVILSEKESEKPQFRDIYFHVDLEKIPIASKYLGNYLRWRVSNFSYTESEPYTIEKRINDLRKALKKSWDEKKK